MKISVIEMPVGKMQNQSQRQNRNLRLIKNQGGVTLFEVLLYIGLFSILCVSSIYLYISIVKTVDSVKLSMQRVEVLLFIHERVRYKMDHHVETPIVLEDFDRIMKFYPNLKLSEIKIENIDEYRVKYAKIEYHLVHKSINKLSEKNFTQTIFIRSL